MESSRIATKVVIAGLVLGCDDDQYRHYPPGDDNEILFGIEQSVGSAGGKHVSASYELLGLANKGGWVAEAFRDGDGDGRCYYEDLDHRLDGLHPESGVAKFAGGQLPGSGVLVLANQNASTELDGAGWATGDALTFEASGFAMPELRPIRMTAPRGELEVTSISPAIGDGGSMTLTPNDSVKVSWTPVSEDRGMRVMAALVTEDAASSSDAGAGKALRSVRCFGTGASGGIVIPNLWIARLFSTATPSVRGHIEIATHRQATILARGDWTVYVVATSLIRRAAFAGSR